MKKSAIVSLVVSLVLVAAIAVGTTLAYFSAQTEIVTNTFTTAGYGDGSIWLDEVDYAGIADVNDPDTRPAPGTSTPARVISNTYENMMPGTVVTKDPTVHIGANTMESYVVVKVQGIDALRAKGLIVGMTDATNAVGNIGSNYNSGYWVRYDEKDGVYGPADPMEQNPGDDLHDGYYVYTADDNSHVISTGDAALDLPALFNYAQYDATRSDAALAETDALTIQAALVQATNVELEVAVKTAVDLFNGTAA